MELATIKTLWEKENLFPPLTLQKDSLSFLLHCSHTEKTLLYKIKRKETFMTIASAVCLAGLLFLLIWSKIYFDEFEGIHSVLILWASILTLALLWQIYKQLFLKKIDIANMGVLALFSKITHYRQFLFTEYIVGLFVFFIFFFISLAFLEQDYYLLNTNSNFLLYPINYFVIIIMTLISRFKLSYFRDLKGLKKNISQIKDYEKEQ